MPAEVKHCYEELHIIAPASMGPYFKSLAEGNKRSFIKDSKGYRLVKSVRDDYDVKYGKRQSAEALDQLLATLPTKVNDPAERTYLEEALLCFRYRAYRASVVMSWNLAYHRFRQFVLDYKSAEFNASITNVCGAKPKISAVSKLDDFEELQEKTVLEIARNAKILSPSTYKILTHALDRRNTAAHPSLVVIDHIQAEAHMADLVQNIVLKFV